MHHNPKTSANELRNGVQTSERNIKKFRTLFIRQLHRQLVECETNMFDSQHKQSLHLPIIKDKEVGKGRDCKPRCNSWYGRKFMA